MNTKIKWVKAEDYMPNKEGRYVVKRLGEPIICDARLFMDRKMRFVTPNGMVWSGYKKFEWLEEQTNPVDNIVKREEKLLRLKATVKAMINNGGDPDLNAVVVHIDNLLKEQTKEVSNNPLK